jgi:hypothetical protein
LALSSEQDNRVQSHATMDVYGPARLLS